MSESSNYWTRSRITRRTAIQRTAVAGGGLAALGLAACGGSSKPAGTSATTSATRAALDPTKGKQGGKITIQQYGDPGGGLELVKIRNQGVHQLAGFTHDGLLEYRNGTPAFPGTDIQTQPNLAQAMPEQPDPLTYVFKLRQAKFHNGRAVDSSDVKYSFDRYAFGADSALKTDWVFLDSVSTPDPQTVVVKTKYAYADALQDLAQRYFADILCKEHEESPEAQKKLLGSGAFLFVDYQPPVAAHYKRNPEYHRQPYPYFDEIEFLENSDTEKKIVDFSTRKVQMTYWFDEEARDRVKKARPDAQLWSYPGSMGNLFMRSDKAPFNDKRVRQALSMAIDRKALSQAVTQGEGEPDQALSIAGVYWGFRKPKDLGAAAKYWNYDPQAAKQLLAAAGVSLPMKFELPHWNASVIGPKFVDTITLIEAQWRNAGIADVKDTELTFGQAAGTISIGNYDAMQWYPSTVGYVPDIGLMLKNQLWAPPEGIKAPPTLNQSWISNPQLSALAEKQLGQFNKEERIQTFRQIEDILAEEQYRIGTVTISNNWFGDPSVFNMQTARDAYNGAIPYVKYWWFGKA
jgi:ABC-type transport system substrate-binding protein